MFIADLKAYISELKYKPQTKRGSTATLYGEMQKILQKFADNLQNYILMSNTSHVQINPTLECSIS